MHACCMDFFLSESLRQTAACANGSRIQCFLHESHFYTPEKFFLSLMPHLTLRVVFTVQKELFWSKHGSTCLIAPHCMRQRPEP